MSDPIDPARPAALESLRGSLHELRRRGRAFGIDYDVGIRVLALSDPEGEPRVAESAERGASSDATAPARTGLVAAPPVQQGGSAEPVGFADAILAASDELRLEPHSAAGLSRAAGRIDQLGRRLHGLGLLRDREVAGCLTAAVWELSLARDQAEGDRAESVRRAILQLEAARAHTGEGLDPQR